MSNIGNLVKLSWDHVLYLSDLMWSLQSCWIHASEMLPYLERNTSSSINMFQTLTIHM